MIRWSPEAEADRIAIFQRTAADSIFAADALDVLFEEGAELLRDAPDAGRTGTVAGTFELVVHPHYRIVYQRGARSLDILALAHTSLEWPG